MKEQLEVLLVEDEPQTCEEIEHYTDTLSDVLLVGTTNSADNAVEKIGEYLPDAVILDLELHKGGGDGLSMLQKMRALQLPYIPYILITTNNSSPTTHEMARKLGADFILSKHQAGYSGRTPVDFLRMLAPEIQSRRRKAPTAPSISPAAYKNRLVRRIDAELNRIGINPKVLGYTYLSEAIQLLMEDPTARAESDIAQKHRKTVSSVERAMQGAINRAWSSVPIDELLSAYTAKIQSSRGVPTVTEFTHYYANKLRYEE